jgi:hypothetical protein
MNEDQGTTDLFWARQIWRGLRRALGDLAYLNRRQLEMPSWSEVEAEGRRGAPSDHA